MKKITGIFIIACFAIACQNSGNKKNESAAKNSPVAATATQNAPKAVFEHKDYYFGIILMGQTITHEFKFKNVGKTPLIIKDASATCGCTVPQFPLEPVLPNQTAIIKVVFDSQGKSGKQDKIVTLYSNAQPEMEKLHLIGEVHENNLQYP